MLFKVACLVLLGASDWRVFNMLGGGFVFFGFGFLGFRFFGVLVILVLVFLVLVILGFGFLGFLFFWGSSGGGVHVIPALHDGVVGPHVGGRARA